MGLFPENPAEGKAIYLPKDTWADAYDPPKRRKKCECGARGEWIWRQKTTHAWSTEIICSRCLIDVKLADQQDKVEMFVRKAILVAAGDQEKLKKLSETINVVEDPPTLTEKGYWNLAHVAVLTHKFSNRRMRP